jgi:hypothetical protein
MGLTTLIAAASAATIAAAAPLAACELQVTRASPVLAEVQSGTQLNGIRVNGVRANGIRINGPSPGAAPSERLDAKDVADSGGFRPLTVILPDGRGLIAE